MDLGAVAAIVGLGIGVSINAAGTSLVILWLMRPGGMRRAVAYVLGSVVTETAIIVAVLLLIREANKYLVRPTDLSPGPTDVVAWLIALLGAVLIVTGIYMLRRGPRRSSALLARALRDVDSAPSWLAFAIGASLVSWTMPVVAAAEMQVAQQPLQLPVGLLLYAVFMALAVSTVLAPILVVIWRPQGSRKLLRRTRDWLDRNGGTTAAIVTIVFGVVFAARGMVALLS